MPHSSVFQRAMDAVACISADTPPWTDILTTGRDLIGADSGSLIMMNGSGELLNVDHVGLSDATISDYAEHYHRVDLLAHASLGLAPGTWLDSNVAIPRSQLLRSEFHNDYLRKHRQEQIFALLLERNSERLTGFSFQRSSIEEGASEYLAAGEVGVYVREFQRALAQKRSSMAENLKVLDDTLSSLGEAACLVTAGGAITRASDAALAMLDNQDGLTIKKGRLHHPLSGVLAYIQRNLALALVTGAKSKATVSISRGETLVLDIAPASSRLKLANERLLVVRIRRCSAFGAPNVESLVHTFGITQAEANVLAGLVAGLAPAEYAQENGVSESTVRTQVASIKMKLGCSRVVDLVKMAVISQS